MKLYVVPFDRQSPLIAEFEEWWKLKTGKYGYMRITGSDSGFASRNEEGFIAATFFYPTVGSSMCITGNFISNPSVSKELRREAVDSLVAYIETYAKKLNYGQLLTYSGSEGSEALFSRLKWAKADTGVTTYFKIL